VRRDGHIDFSQQRRKTTTRHSSLLVLLSDVEEITLMLLSICLEKLLEAWYKEGNDLCL
jgi:hypothetical protein